MGNWNNFYLQRMGTAPGGGAYPVCESVRTWGIWCMDIPYKVFDKVKAPAKRSWHDEHGDDEYIGNNGLYMEAYTIKVKFGCKRITGQHDTTMYSVTVSDVRQKVRTFLEYLRGAGMMKLYSSHTRIGRQNVRLDSVDDNAKWKDDGDGEFLVFEVTLKVNDPQTDVVLGSSSSD